MRRPWLFLAALPLLAGLGGFPEKAEFYFLRLEYKDAPFVRRPWGRGWWMQDMPEAEVHFSQGIERLTRIHVGDCRHTPLTDNRIYEYPWIYATQVGWWDLSEPEVLKLRDYLDRGGFLVVDDFHGDRDWQLFAASMARVLPGKAILDIEDTNPVMNLVFDIKERTFIPGLRHLRRPRGSAEVAGRSNERWMQRFAASDQPLKQSGDSCHDPWTKIKRLTRSTSISSGDGGPWRGGMA